MVLSEASRAADSPIETVQQAFEQYERDVARVDPDDIAAAREIHPKLRDAVADAVPVKRDFLAGSDGRRTQALRLKDIDVITVVDDPAGSRQFAASGTLRDVQEALSGSDLVRLTVVKVRAVK